MADKYFTSVDDFVKTAASPIGMLRNIAKTRPWLLAGTLGATGLAGGAGAGLGVGMALQEDRPAPEMPAAAPPVDMGGMGDMGGMDAMDAMGGVGDLGTGYGISPAEIMKGSIGGLKGVGTIIGAGALLGLGQQLGKGTGDAIGGGAKRLFQTAYTSAGPDYLSDLQMEDDIIAGADPGIMDEAMQTMQRFAPSLSTDKPSVRAFLREAATTGSGVNYNTVKLLAEAEQAAQKAGGGF